MLDKLRIVDWKRLVSAPKSALAPPTADIAVSSATKAADAPDADDTLKAPIPKPVAEKPLKPVGALKFTLMVWPLFAPTKNVAE